MASGFHHGERQVTVCLGPLFMGIPEDYRIFLSSHLEDEARHTIFFDRFYREVVGMPGDTIMDLLDESYPFVGDGFVGPFGLARLPHRRPAPQPVRQAPADAVRGDLHAVDRGRAGAVVDEGHARVRARTARCCPPTTPASPPPAATRRATCRPACASSASC